MNKTLHFGKLRRTLAWDQKEWFLFVLEPEPILCEVKWSFIAYARELSEVMQSSFRFIKPCFCFQAESSVLAGRDQFQIEDGLKSTSVIYMRQLVTRPHSQYISFEWEIEKFTETKKWHFPMGPKVQSAEFIIRFFALGIAVEKWYQMCLLNFKSFLLAKEIRVYPLLIFNL